jgi:hypothetical protein
VFIVHEYFRNIGGMELDHVYLTHLETTRHELMFFEQKIFVICQLSSSKFDTSVPWQDFFCKYATEPSSMWHLLWCNVYLTENRISCVRELEGGFTVFHRNPTHMECHVANFLYFFLPRDRI